MQGLAFGEPGEPRPGGFIPKLKGPVLPVPFTLGEFRQLASDFIHGPCPYCNGRPATLSADHYQPFQPRRFLGVAERNRVL
jgi:hypothetical protein